jgi:hypothetical protein
LTATRDLNSDHTSVYKLQAQFCDNSACKKDWKSGVTKTVVLEDKDSTVFSLFATWVEAGHIGNSEDYVEVNYSEADENQTASQREKFQKDSEAQLYQLAQCYVL